MKAVLSFFVLSFGAVVTEMERGCFMTGFYLELGCTPVPSEDTSCPVAFKCPDLHPDPNMCYYRGEAYGNLTAIPQNRILAPCSQACSCSVNSKPEINCASVDCVETFDSDSQEQCINIFELESCCSTDNVCGKDAIAELKTCDVDGETYYEGQQMEPMNSGQICICSADWNDNQENSTLCRDINCGLELHHQNEIMGKCAPIFYGNRICPNEFQCPTKDSKIIRGLNIRNNEAQCMFGDATLWVGDEVSFNDKCMVCTCNIPPFVSCKRKNDCDEEPKI